jgi:predicted phage tail protein
MNTEVLIPVIRIVNPFDPRDAVRETLVWKSGQTLADYFPAGMVEHVVSINGQPVEPEDMASTYLDRTDNLVICPIPTGGGGGKNILRVVAMIAIAVYAPYAAGAMYGAMGGTLVMANAGMMLGALTAGVTLAGGMLVNALLAPPKASSGASSDIADGSSYGIDGAKNTSAEGIPVPVCYGTFRQGGNVLNAFVENEGTTQSLYLLLNAGEGPVASLGDLRINDQPIANYKKVETQVRLGEANQPIISWFGDTTTPVSLNKQLVPGEYVLYETSGPVDRLRFDLVFPAGMGLTSLSDGKRSAVSVAVEIEVRLKGSSAWSPVGTRETGFSRVFHYVQTTPGAPIYSLGRVIGWTASTSSQVTSNTLPANYSFDDSGGRNVVYYDYTYAVSGQGDESSTVTEYAARTEVGTFDKVPTYEPGITVSENSTSPVRRSYHTGTLAQGVYECRLRRTTPDTKETHIQDDVSITDVNEIILDDVAYANTALVALKIQLDEQLSGMPTVTFLNGGRRIRSFDFAANAWVEGSSSNPAWIVLDALTHTRYGASMPVSRFDIEMFLEWARYCEQANLTFNGVIESAMNVWDALQPVMRCGHAQIVNVGTRYTVVIERPAAPTMMFGVGNIIEGTFKETWLGMADRSNEIDVTFFDKADDYKQRSIRVVDVNAISRGDTQRPSAITLAGVVDREKAYKEGFFQLNLNRYILQTVEFSAPTEAIACTVGDLIYVQHDMPQWGFAGRTAPASTASVIQLDREVPLEAAKQYKLLLKFDAVRRGTGTINAVIGNTLTLSNGGAGALVKRIKANGIDRAVLSSFAGGIVIEPGGVGEFSAGMPYELWDTDVIEERDVVAQPGNRQVLTAMTPFSAAPDAFVNWMFGEVSKVRKPFRVKAINGTHEYKRDLSCVEYNASCYDFSGMALPTGNYSSLASGVAHVIFDGVTESVVTSGRGNVTNVTVGFYSNQSSYSSCTVKASVNGRAFEVIATEAKSSASLYCEAGDTVVFKAIASDVVGATASEGTAPTLTYTVSGASKAAPVVKELAINISSLGAIVSWAQPANNGVSDWAVTQIRLGESWDTGVIVFTGKATSANIGWLKSGLVKVWAANANTTGSWSAATMAQIQVNPPTQPLVTAEVWRNEVTLSWQDCTASQPIAGYSLRVGATLATSVQFDLVSSLGSVRNEETPGNYMYWVFAIDAGGNAGVPGYILVTVLPSIDEAIDALTMGLDVIVEDIKTDLTLLRVKDAFSASVAAVSNSIEIVERADGDEALSVRVESLVAQTNTDHASALAAVVEEARVRTSADEASASLITQVSASVTSRPNLCQDVSEWTGATELVVDTAEWGVHAKVLNPADGTHVWSSPKMTIQAGAKVIITGDSSLALDADGSGSVYFDLRFYSASDALLLDSGQAPILLAHDFDMTGVSRLAHVVEAVAPVNCSYMRARFVASALSKAASVGFRQVKVERGTLPATPYTLESALLQTTALVKVEAQARANETGALFAKYGVTLSAGGKVSGFRINNDSEAGSDFVILTDRFAIAQDVDGTTKYPFTVGLIDGVSSIGINANMYVDGTIKTRMLEAESVTADKINGTNLSVVNGTFSGKLIGATGSFSGALSAASGSFAGALNGADITGTTGTFSGKLAAGTVDFASSVGSTIYRDVGTHLITVPSAMTSMRVLLIGAGGGGAGGGKNDSGFAGGGGGAGGRTSFSLTVSPGQQFTIVCGVGGAGGGGGAGIGGNWGSYTPGNTGGTGGQTYLAGYIAANGGAGGDGYGNGGAGGAATNGVTGESGGLGNAGGAGGTGAAVPSYGAGGTSWHGGASAGTRGGGGGGGHAHLKNYDYSSPGGAGGNGYAVIEFFNEKGVVLRGEMDKLKIDLTNYGINITP